MPNFTNANRIARFLCCLILQSLQQLAVCQIWQATDVFNVPGATFSTNPDNPMLGYSSDGTNPVAVSGTTELNGPEAWLEMSCTGPGIVRFAADVSDGSDRIPVFVLELDGHAFPLTVPEIAGHRYAMCISAGNHRLRWVLRPNQTYGPPIPAAGKLSALTFTSSAEFVKMPVGEVGGVLCEEGDLLTIREENGMPILSVPSSSHPGGLHEIFQWHSTSGGMLNFRWREVPNIANPQTENALLLRVREQNEFIEELVLSRTAQWQEKSLLVAQPNADIRLGVFVGDPPLEISNLTFAPYAAIEIGEAMGMPGVNFTTTEGSEWFGLRAPDGTGVVSPGLSYFKRNLPGDHWMEASITGPLEITWHEDMKFEKLIPWASEASMMMDGEFLWPSPIPILGPKIAPSSYSFVIPAGTHVIRWNAQGGLPFFMENFAVNPISQAYLDWHPFDVPLPPSGDFDGDGQSDLMEFTYRTDPLTMNPEPTLRLLREGGELFILVAESRPSTDGVRVSFEISCDLATWTEAHVEAVPSNEIGLQKFRLTAPPNGKCLYVRTKVQLTGP